jgi:hypothetical protein
MICQSVTALAGGLRVGFFLGGTVVVAASDVAHPERQHLHGRAPIRQERRVDQPQAGG